MTTRLKRFDWSGLDAAARAEALSRPAVTNNPDLEQRCGEIIAAVQTAGDKAVAEFTRRFDGVELDSFRVDDAEIAWAQAQISDSEREAMATAIGNVKAFHAAQATAPVRVETMPGVVCERVTRPVSAVGLYVPAGTAPLPSTAIMLAVPAALAECPQRVICTPPRPDGRADPAVIVAALLSGCGTIYKIGGAQAVAAMAYGTETVPKVDKIFGPGNTWVTAAKKLVANDPAGAALDMPAGPSEVMVIADTAANPRFVALDLMAQSEHGVDSQSVLVCTDAAIADQVEAEINALLPELSRRETIESALANGRCFIVESIESAVEVANDYAAEHLILQIKNARQTTVLINNAGSVFIGEWTPEAVGDYCSGTNHVLPTYGFARNYSGLSLQDFQKQLTLQEATRTGLDALAPTVATLARLEGLDAHARSVSARLEVAPEHRKTESGAAS